MGNCLASQEKAIKVMKTDGEVLEYKAPMKVFQVLSEYVGHAISDTLPVIHHLRQDADMIGGQLYFLLPLPLPSLKLDKMWIQHSSPKLVEGEDSSGVLRIKLVISKQELKAMMVEFQLVIWFLSLGKKKTQKGQMRAKKTVKGGSLS